MAQIDTCPVCRASDSEHLLTLPNVPVLCHRLARTRAEAMATPRADLRLVHCRTCNHLYNAAFQSALLAYGPEYENSLHHSARFRGYLLQLINRLAQQGPLAGKHVVEVGCGDGAFLQLLCDQVGCTATGIDPALAAPVFLPSPGGANLTLLAVDLANAPTTLAADLVVSRHVLEHQAQPAQHLRALQAMVAQASPGLIYLEVPNAGYMMEANVGWDLLYEHGSYFTERSLTRLVIDAGLQVVATWQGFGDQFLCMLASVVQGQGNHVGQTQRTADHLAQRFGRQFRHTVSDWRARLKQWRQAGSRVVVWGAGTKGVMFLHSMAKAGAIEYVVDLNPRKQGCYIVGSGEQIVAPDFLQRYRPDRILILNRAYAQEIQEMVTGMQLELKIEFP